MDKRTLLIKAVNALITSKQRSKDVASALEAFCWSWFSIDFYWDWALSLFVWDIIRETFDERAEEAAYNFANSGIYTVHDRDWVRADPAHKVTYKDWSVAYVCKPNEYIKEIITDPEAFADHIVGIYDQAW